MIETMASDVLLDSMRGLLIVVHGDGMITEARGGFGGFLGIDVASLPGTNVFEYVAETDADELAIYFLESVDESEETISLPMPFRMSIIDGDGFAHPVDVIPTGTVDNDEWTWTVLVMPLALNGSITRSLDLEMAGAPRELVRRMLCEELRVDNASYTTRWLLIELDDPTEPDVIVARSDDQPVADAVRNGITEHGWRPWENVERGETRPLHVPDFPDSVKAVMDTSGWQRSVVAPVHVKDRLVAVFLLVGRTPSNFDPLVIKRNVAGRVQTLVRATAMLCERWSDQDRLEIAATTDELTGLDNRREMLAHLASERRSGSLLYVDVDDFKSVNDRFGHMVGDSVLIEIARRIQSVCRPGDRIGRLGGDEFVVILPGADEDLASDIAQRIIDRVAEPLNVEARVYDVSVSIGHSPLGTASALDAADQAMLRAKREGRGRHLLATPGDV